MKQRIIITVAVLFIVVAASATGIFFAFNILGDWKREEQTLRQEIVQEDQRERRLSALRAAFEGVKVDESKLGSYFFQSTEEDWLRFVNALDELGRIANVKAVTSAADFVPGQPFTADISISGSWEDCYTFFVLLDSFPARLNVKKFSLQGASNPQEAKSDSKWTGNVSLELASIRLK